MQTILQLLSYALYVYGILFLLRAVASFTRPDPYSNDLMRWLYMLTEPVLEPIRALLPQSGIDFSPMVAMILIFALNRALSILAASL